jgi:carbonic anhydrase
LKITADQALQRLKRGNQRYVAEEPSLHRKGGHERRQELTLGQNPFAIVLGCSDARVPAEIVFDQGPGDLFVIRVAGNIVAPTQVGSVEFAAAQFGTPLVVVLGHSDCGAVKATLEEIRAPAGMPSPNLAMIVDRIRPAAERVLQQEQGANPAELVRKTVRANVQASVDQLRHGSGLLEELISAGKLVIVGAKYSISSGRVEFLDDSDPA